MENEKQPESIEEVVDARRMRTIARGLRSRRFSRQQYWLGQLLDAGPAAIPFVERELERDYRLQSRLYWLNAAVTPVGLGLGLYNLCHGEWDALALTLTMLLGLFGTVRHLTVNGFRPVTSKTRLTSILANSALRMRNPSAAGLLLDLWLFEPKDKYIHTALREVLPAIAESDTGYLKPRHQDALHRIVRGPSDASLQRSALSALERVGTTDAISHIERLSTSVAKEKWQQELREAARECLESLRARLAAEQASATLLRAAGGCTDYLLQPAGSPAAQEAEALLRPMHD